MSITSSPPQTAPESLAQPAEHAEPAVVTIEAKSGWQSLELRELWRYRELLYFLTWRDVKIKYKQTVFGATWAVMQPLASMLVFSILFGRLVGLNKETGGIPYPIFVFAGLLPWNLFNQCLLGASGSLVGNSNMITKIYFPRLIIPIAAAGGNLVNFAISLAILLVMMAYYQIMPGMEILLLPVLLVLALLASLAVGIWLAAMNVAYRDFRHAVPFIAQMWMYLTPVIWPVTIVPEQWRWIIALNPLAGIVDGFRYSLFGQPLDWTRLLIASAVTVVAFLAAVFYFRRVETHFADII